MKRIYIVSTYYHALIACVKQLAQHNDTDILVTAYIPDYELLAARLREASLFDRVFCAGVVSEYEPANKLDMVFNLHRKNAALIEQQLDINLREYNDITIFHDDTWMAHYLKSARIPYRLAEDSLDCFKTLSGTKFGKMLHKRGVKSWIKERLRIGYVFLGYDRYTLSVEVNDAQGLEITDLAMGKIVEVPRKPLFDRLTDDDILLLKSIFMKDLRVGQLDGATLIITQPLYADNMVESEEAQLEVYLQAVKNFDRNIVIKPHPRDTADYRSVFPQAVILDKNMPLEIIGLVLKPHFERTVSVNSTCANAVDADEHISVSIG